MNFGELARTSRQIPYTQVIEMLSGRQVIPLDLDDQVDCELIDRLTSAIRECCKILNHAGIPSGRVNEVGNKIESPVTDAINRLENGLRAETPTDERGRRRATGYPDLLITDRYGRHSYLEVKTYNRNNIATTQRSFYLSPSQNFKVIHDARHLLVSFEIVDKGELPDTQPRMNLYVPVHFKLISLDQITCDLKLEFNSDNVRLYSEQGIICAEDV